jgi:hypothetical protein
VFGWIRILWFVRAGKDAEREGCPCVGPNKFPLWGANGLTTTACVLAIIYFTQAAVGIAFGIVYAVRAMYPA